MPQIFTKHQILGMKFAALLVLALAVALVLSWKAGMGFGVGLHETVGQPVPFSHKHHVSDDGLDCRYCHGAVERAASAGMPSTKTCMTCHSQLFTEAPLLQPVRDSYRYNRPLRWKRVYDLPDFVYFDHSIHIHHGVGCVSCHGQVDRMPLIRRARSLNMQWCLDCHRDPAPHLRPRDQVFNMNWRPPKDRGRLGNQLMAFYGIDTERLTDCSICHR